MSRVLKMHQSLFSSLKHCRSRYTDYQLSTVQYPVSAWLNMVEVNKSLPRLNLSCMDEYTLAESGYISVRTPSKAE